MKIKLFIVLFSSLLLVNCSKDEGEELSSENKILSFKLIKDGEEFNGEIKEPNKTILITVSDLDLSTPISPRIEISEGASISPSAFMAQNFYKDIVYTVTAENGEEANYTVTAKSSDNKILSFNITPIDTTFFGEIDQLNKTITIETRGLDINSNLIPEIEFSKNATISPAPLSEQDFSQNVEYTVTAQSGEEATYTVITKDVPVLPEFFSFNTINSAYNTSNIATKYYSNATPYVRTSNIDLSLPNSKIILENDLHSYDLNFTNYGSYMNSDIMYTSFQIEFPTNIATAKDYKLKYIVNGLVKSISYFEIDILANNIPDITTSNQTSYSYNDTLILTGENLVPGVRIVAHNIQIYQYDQSYVSINSDASQLTLPLTTNQNMFPSWVGQPSPYQTPIIIYFNGRYGESIVVDFS